MGRLTGRRARLHLTAFVCLVLPLVALVGSQLRTGDGVPLITFVVAILIAYQLSVGPRAAPVLWLGMVLELVLTRGVAPGAAVVVLGAAQAAVVLVGTHLLERRFVTHGPVRRPIVMVEFAVVAGALVPLGVEAVLLWLGPPVGVTTGAALLRCAVPTGLGVLGLTGALRMLVMGQHRQLDRTRLPAALGTAAVSAAAALAVVRFAGEDAVGAEQLLAVPVLALALLMGTVGYALAVAGTTLGVVVPLAAVAAVGQWEVSTADLVSWWVVGFLGLLLATDGDRRRATAAEFRSFFLRSATPSLTVNTSDGRVLRANDALAALLDRPRVRLVGRDITTLVPDRGDLHDRLQSLRRGDVVEVVAEFALPQADGDERWVRCTALRVDLGGPQHDVLQVQFLDLTTERVRATSLERTNESLEQFGRRVTHDLKQPVAAVAAYATTLLEHGERFEPAMVRAMHERLAASARRAVDQLDATFAATAARDPGRVDVRLHELVAEVVGVIDIDLVEAGGTVATNLMRGHVQSEPGVLRQVLLNLLTNSCKYARPGEAPRINVTSRVRGAGVELIVTDNGTGIPATSLELVFERGVRLAPGRADGGGHGLADSRDLAASLGGTLHAEPWPDGARVVLWLPDPTAAAAQAATRVLVVADESASVDQLRHRLAHRSAIDLVGTVSTIGEAVLAARDGRPDVVLIGEQLRVADGATGILEIARAHRDARIMLLAPSARDDHADRTAGIVRTVDLAMDDEALVGGLLGRAG